MENTTPPPPPPPPAVTAAPKDNSVLIFSLLSHGAPLISLGIILPLILWLVKKDESQVIGDEAKEALNFQLTAFLACLACIPLTFVLIGIPLLIVIGLAVLVFAIMAIISAVDGKAYRYPYTLRLIK